MDTKSNRLLLITVLVKHELLGRNRQIDDGHLLWVNRLDIESSLGKVDVYIAKYILEDIKDSSEDLGSMAKTNHNLLDSTGNIHQRQQ